MYTQFFGNYLFSNGHITKEQLLSALARQSKTSIRISTMALYTGYMSAQEVEYVIDLQKKEGKRFGELAIRDGYLTQAQVVEILNMKVPDFLILGQIFIEDGIFTFKEFENIFADYRSQTEFMDLELNEDNKNDFQTMIEGFSIISEAAIPDFGKAYLELLFNNFVRYIGDDFTSLPPSIYTEFLTERCVSQLIKGDYLVNTYLSMDEATALEFASRYSGEDFDEYNEYVSASIEDLLNLHNGVFIVNASNYDSNELNIGTLEFHDNTILSFERPAFVFPICYPFGIIYFIMEIISLTGTGYDY
ncbi:MAG: chemotaxis protein CheX [Agathobacter sp.]|nr:chemotaxis protein CheX [Agathobacter sp.]